MKNRHNFVFLIEQKVKVINLIKYKSDLKKTRIEFVGEGDGFAHLAGENQLLDFLPVSYAVPVFRNVLKK